MLDNKKGFTLFPSSGHCSGHTDGRQRFIHHSSGGKRFSAVKWVINGRKRTLGEFSQCPHNAQKMEKIVHDYFFYLLKITAWRHFKRSSVHLRQINNPTFHPNFALFDGFWSWLLRRPPSEFRRNVPNKFQTTSPGQFQQDRWLSLTKDTKHSH